MGLKLGVFSLSLDLIEKAKNVFLNTYIIFLKIIELINVIAFTRINN